SDLVDWIVAFQSGEVDHTIKRWRDTESVAWLVAALALVGPTHDTTAELRQAAAELPPESPAYATATYHRVRLTADTDEARALLDRLLPALRDAVPKTALNLFLAQRMALATNLDEFLQFAPRYPVGRGLGIGESDANSLDEVSPDRLFDSDSVAIINRGLPLSLLAEAATSTKLPEGLRRQLVMVTWVRAVLLEDQETAIRVAKPLERFYPELAPDLSSWRSAADAEQKRFAAALLLLRFPGLKPHLVTGLGMRTKAAGIEDLRDNWWCSFGLERDLDVYSMHRYYASINPREDSGDPPAEVPPAFLTESERTELTAEWSRL
ncbi:MAG: hypothetical protein GY953_35885, partial [bacterium]|nr:hypothetical protein [bacterium]